MIRSQVGHLVTVLFVTCFFPITGKSKSNPVNRLVLGPYVISYASNEKLIFSQTSNYSMALYKNRANENIIVYKQAPGQSIDSVKARAKEDNVSVNKIKYHIKNDSTVFWYPTQKDQIKIFSTLGGQILITKRKGQLYSAENIKLLDTNGNRRKL